MRGWKARDAQGGCSRHQRPTVPQSTSSSTPAVTESGSNPSPGAARAHRHGGGAWGECARNEAVDDCGAVIQLEAGEDAGLLRLPRLRAPEAGVPALHRRTAAGVAHVVRIADKAGGCVASEWGGQQVRRQGEPPRGLPFLGGRIPGARMHARTAVVRRAGARGRAGSLQECSGAYAAGVRCARCAHMASMR